MTILDDLQKLSTAEDFFAALEIPYDPAVVRVARLHIMRRMGQYLKGADFTGLNDAEQREECRSHLLSAYEDFVKSSPIQERVFKVHKEAVEPKPEPAKPFVPLAALSLPGGE